MGRTTSRALALAVLMATACSGESADLHLDEPLLVQDSEFQSSSLADEEAEGEAAITSISFSVGSVRAGARGVPVSGRASGDAYAVAIGLEGQGSGYWTHRVGAEDPVAPGELTFDVLVDLGANVEPGPSQLRIAAVDERGALGEAQLLDICILPEFQDNGNACDPSVAPPLAVLSLSWDSDADLDLTLVSPSGKVYNKSRRGVADDAGKVLASFDRDSNSGCVLDNKRREDFVIQELPESGKWRVYANMFDACGAVAARFTAETYQRRKTGEDSYALRRVARVHGQFLRAQADGGGGSPLYLTSFEL
jgi:hypothetical protein